MSPALVVRSWTFYSRKVGVQLRLFICDFDYIVFYEVVRVNNPGSDFTKFLDVKSNLLRTTFYFANIHKLPN